MDQHFRPVDCIVVGDSTLPCYNGQVYELINEGIKEDIVRDLQGLLVDNRVIDDVTTMATQRYDSQQYLVTYSYKLPMTYLYLTICRGVQLSIYIIPDMSLKNKYRMYSVKHRVTPDMYRGTLFAGHLLPSERVYTIVDLVVSKGELVSREALGPKLYRLNLLLDTEYQPDAVLDPVRLYLTDYVENRYIRSLLSQASRQNKTYIDGLFMSSLLPDRGHLRLRCDLSDFVERASDSKTTLGGQRETSKSAALLLERSDKPDVFHVLSRDNSRSHEIACIPDKATSLWMHELFRHSRQLILNCVFNEKFARWQPVSVSNRRHPE